MSCDHSLIEQHLFDYLEGRCEPPAGAAIEQALAQCEHCRSIYQSAIDMQRMEQNWQPKSVPQWHRTRYAVARHSRAGSNWLNLTSLATSLVALLMVFFRVEFTTTENGFSVSFGGKASQAQISEYVEHKLDQLALDQIHYIDNRFAEQRLQQASDTQQMLATLLEHNRQERRQELNLLMATWLQQRDLDQKKLNQRVDYLLDNQIENNRYLNQILKTSAQSFRHP
jgi:hypothetical protein